MVKWLWLSLGVAILDQITKQMAEAALTLYQPVPVLPFFNLMLAYNTGAAFSFLAGAGGWQTWFFLILALVVSVVLIFWLARLPRGERWQAVALALIIGGAIGNVIDRALFGHVIDFIQLHYGGWYFPAFNLADAAISVGAVMMLIDAFFGGKDASVNRDRTVNN